MGGAPSSSSPVVASEEPIDECPSNGELQRMLGNSCAEYTPDLSCPLRYIVTGCTLEELECAANDWVECSSFEGIWIRGMYSRERHLSLQDCSEVDGAIDPPEQGNSCDPSTFGITAKGII